MRRPLLVSATCSALPPFAFRAAQIPGQQLPACLWYPSCCGCRHSCTQAMPHTRLQSVFLGR